MRNSHGKSRAQAVPQQEVQDVMGARCYNCHTTATPLWREDDEGKTMWPLLQASWLDTTPVARSIGGPPSASPGVSRRTSPVPESSPILAPDSITQMFYDYSDDADLQNNSSSSELIGAFGVTTDNIQVQTIFNPFMPSFPPALYGVNTDTLPFSSVDASDAELSMSPRSNKRRRTSTDSAFEPPSTAVSFSSYSGQCASMEFPFSTYNTNGTINQGPALRGSGNTFWHLAMTPQASDNEPVMYHSSSNISSSTSNSSSARSSVDNEDSPMDFLHPPMALPEEK
ncbi:hypothetical protein CVT26_013568 [Gymnopilus dilepis]|uniref:GATA-type domain-containing protein n=1 Tax=Gymnopilus dilepis TaxID=231916 RepID=A0A409WT06_9AGAR|nr:hypothetical protein CVT26_013568 [Gymnopilus dilepis]